MTITRGQVAEKIKQYLRHQISLEELVDWAEDAMQHAEFEEGYEGEITEVVARLGVSDVKNFGLLWEDCESLLNSLGYKVHLDITPYSS